MLIKLTRNEKRLTQASQWLDKPKPVVDYELPASADDFDFVDRVPLYYDLIALALQTDSTRVVSLALADIGTDFGGFNISHGYDQLTHHGKVPEYITELSIIEQFHTSQFARFLEQLKDVQEPGGKTLLDNSMVLFGSGMGNASSHSNKNLLDSCRWRFQARRAQIVLQRRSQQRCYARRQSVRFHAPAFRCGDRSVWARHQHADGTRGAGMIDYNASCERHGARRRCFQGTSPAASTVPLTIPAASTLRLTVLVVTTTVLGVMNLGAAETPDQGLAPFVTDYFQQYCYRCHGERHRKGIGRLDQFPANLLPMTTPRRCSKKPSTP